MSTMKSIALAQQVMKVAIVGVPNAGKSTLVNSLLSTVVCPVSKRVHTTRINQHSAYLHDNTQVVLVDTPGLVNVKEIKKFAFPKDFVFGPEKSVRQADIVAVIHDVSNSISRSKLDPRIKAILEKFPDKNSILILNKVDTIKNKDSLLDIVRILTSGVVDRRPIPLRKTHSTRVKEEKDKLNIENVLKRAKQRYEANLSNEPDLGIKKLDMIKSAFSDDEVQEGLHLVGWSKFHDVFMISALKNEGVDSLKEYFVLNSKPGAWMYAEDFLTDVEPKELTLRVIRALLLERLPQEMPYKLDPQVEFWERNDKGVLRVIIKLECPNSRYVGRVVGSGGVVINSLSTTTETVLSDLLQMPVSLIIHPYAVEKKA